MKRVLFYTDTPLLGGAENQMLLLARFLPKDQYKVSLACSSYQSLNGWCQQFMEQGIDVIRFKVFHKHDPRHYFYLKKILPNFDLLHLHVWNPASARYGLLVSALLPTILTEHDPFRLTGLRAWIKNKLSNNVKQVIAVSEGAAQKILEYNPAMREKMSIVHNGIDAQAWQHDLKDFSRAEFRRQHFKIQGNEKIILCVAELHERKGQAHLIKAMKYVLKEFPNAKLVLVGEGPAFGKYEDLAEEFGESVLLYGRSRDIGHLMAAADIFVLPSIREAFGLVLLEAGLSGLPVVASDTGGIPEIIIHEKTGLLTPPGDEEKLAETIMDLLRSPENALIVSKNLKEKVEKEFSAEQMAQKTAEVYNRCL